MSRTGRFIMLIVGVGVLSVTPWIGRTAQAADPLPIIPRHLLFGNPDKANVQLSPDGRQISFLAAVDGVLNVWVGPADDLAAAKPVTEDKKRGIRAYFWAYTSRHILYIQDKDGDENWHVYSVHLDTGKTMDLTPFDNVQARIEELSLDFPNEILVSINDRTPELHDVHRIDITTGQRSLVQVNTEGFLGFQTADDMKVHFGMKPTPDGGNDLYRLTGDNSWSLFTAIPQGDMLTTQPLGFDKSLKNLYMLDSRGRNTAALTMVNLDSMQAKVLAEDSKADISNILTHPTDKHPQAVQATFERSKWQILDKSIEADLEYLKTVADGELTIASRTTDDDHWIVVYVMDDGPVRYYRYDRQAKKAQFLFTNRKALENAKLAKMHPVTVKSRDGLDMVCYYTLPVSADPDADGKPDSPLAMVLFVHGGPWARDDWGYNPYHQWLANRGYAVLSVNYRSSTGFGKDFTNAGNFEWAGKAHDDLLDAVAWAVKAGIAEKDHVAIMGGSYGGYATLVGLTFTPDSFACGVDIVGPSSLITLLESVPPYWKPLLNVFTSRIGDHRTEKGRKLLESRSPLTYVDRISKPLLIGQGANDPRFKQAESDQIVKAMTRKNIPVTYVLYPDEGHGFARPENNMSFNAVIELFLAKHLGGRAEPMSEDVTGSSITIPQGAQHVPGIPKSIEGVGKTSAGPA